MDGRQGIFVAVDGPKRSGKSAVVDQVVRALGAASVSVLVTKEPTAHFDLANEERHTGVALARLLAADRERHLREVIRPALARSDVVLTDRYIASSLVFQVLDGVPFDTVWSLNSGFLLPDLNIFLTVDAPSAARRLRERATATRFDRALPTTDESAHYDIARAFFASTGVAVECLPNSDDTPFGVTVHAMTKTIVNHLGNHA